MSPSIPPTDRADYVKRIDDCPICHSVRWQNYCRTCDVFFTECNHAPDTEHIDHRAYRWTVDGVVAIPDLDGLLP